MASFPITPVVVMPINIHNTYSAGNGQLSESFSSSVVSSRLIIRQNTIFLFCIIVCFPALCHQLLYAVHNFLTLLVLPECGETTLVQLCPHSITKFQNISNGRNFMSQWTVAWLSLRKNNKPAPIISPTSSSQLPLQTHFDQCYCCNTFQPVTKPVQCD